MEIDNEKSWFHSWPPPSQRFPFGKSETQFSSVPFAHSRVRILQLEKDIRNQARLYQEAYRKKINELESSRCKE